MEEKELADAAVYESGSGGVRNASAFQLQRNLNNKWRNLVRRREHSQQGKQRNYSASDIKECPDGQKSAGKREQSQTCLSFADRKQIL